MKKLILIIALILCSVSISYAEIIPYFEFRYSLLSNEPSLFGITDCPCYGSEIINGWDVDITSKLKWNIENVLVFGARWDDPEIYKFNALFDYRLFKNWGIHILLGYREIHHLDRPTPISPRYIDWSGQHTRDPNHVGWGWSGTHYLWTGFRIEFKNIFK